MQIFIKTDDNIIKLVVQSSDTVDELQQLIQPKVNILRGRRAIKSWERTAIK